MKVIAISNLGHAYVRVSGDIQHNDIPALKGVLCELIELIGSQPVTLDLTPCDMISLDFLAMIHSVDARRKLLKILVRLGTQPSRKIALSGIDQYLDVAHVENASYLKIIES